MFFASSCINLSNSTSLSTKSLQAIWCPISKVFISIEVIPTRVQIKGVRIKCNGKKNLMDIQTSGEISGRKRA